MTAIDFPDSPSDGQTFADFKWNATRSVWEWNVAEPFAVEYLVVAGGGGGGQNVLGGGGGAGGYRSNVSGESSGGGGGSGNSFVTSNRAGGAGGSGVVILRYPSTKTLQAGSGLTFTTSTVSGMNVTTFTAGSDTIVIA